MQITVLKARRFVAVGVVPFIEKGGGYVRICAAVYECALAEVAPGPRQVYAAFGRAAAYQVAVVKQKAALLFERVRRRRYKARFSAVVQRYYAAFFKVSLCAAEDEVSRAAYLAV